MIVQWLGGPEDGEFLEVPDNTREVVTPVREFNNPIFPETTLTPTSHLRTLSHPIRHKNGHYYIMFNFNKE